MAITEKATSHEPSVRRSKVAVGINVTIAVLAAVALVILVNYIVQYASGRGGLRKDFQTLGQYGLSDRTKQILGQVNEPVKLTVIYTSTDRQRSGRKYGPRVVELCQDMARRNPQVSVAVANDDQAKADVLARLRGSLGKEAQAHQKVVRDFLAFADKTSPQLSQEATQWRGLQSAKLLAEFNLPMAIGSDLDQARNDLEQVRDQIQRSEKMSAVPDYPALAETASTKARELSKQLGGIDSLVKDLAALQQAISADGGKLLKDDAAAQQKLEKSIGDLVALLGTEKDPIPANAGEVLKKFGAGCKSALPELSARASAVQSFAKAHKIITSHEEYIIPIGDERGGVAGAQTIPGMYGMVGQLLMQLGAQSQQVADNEAEHVQKTMLQQLRELAGQILPMVHQTGKQWNDILKAAAEADPASKKALDAAQTSSLAEAAKAATQIADAAAKLPKVEQSELTRQLTEDNLVLVEAGGKVAVVDFDSIWPVARLQTGREGDEGPRRVFNGDQAITSQILEMTHKPFAEVVLAYFEFSPPPQLRGQMPTLTGDLPRQSVQSLVDALKKARLEVTDWNLAGDPMAGPEGGKIPDPPPAKDGLPRILVVLPPPPDLSMYQQQQMPLPTFTAQHAKKIIDLIQAGTPAIFLTGYSPRPSMGDLPGGQPQDPLTEYLQKTWGVKVQSNLRVVMGEPDPLHPGRFDINLAKFQWMPLSGFTDQPVGKPLRARQLHWLDLCPLALEDKLPQGVHVEPILRVGPDATNVWAVADMQALGDKEGRDVAPDAKAGDVVPPFNVILAAARKSPKADQRIIVAGIGRTCHDQYVRQPVRSLSPNGTIESSAPPTGVLDLMTNACYWLAGQQDYIGVGPADLTPVGDIAPAKMRAMEWLVVGVWPMAVLLIGMLVMMARRR